MKERGSELIHARKQEVVKHSIMTVIHRADQSDVTTLGRIRFQDPIWSAAFEFRPAQKNRHHETVVYQ